MPASPSSKTAAGRERILAAAAELFAERGFDRTSTARLAAAAGVPQGLIFYHFGTKEELLHAIVRERSGQVLADLAPPETPGDPYAAIAVLWSRMRGQLGKEDPVHRIVIREADNHPELYVRALEIYDSIADSVARYLVRATGRTGEPTTRDRVAARVLVTTSATASVTGCDDLSATEIAGLVLDGLR